MISFDFQALLEKVLGRFLDKKLYSERHIQPQLHYGSDLSPDKCQRQIWHELHTPELRRPLTLGEKIRFYGGHAQEALIAEAFEFSLHNPEDKKGLEALLGAKILKVEKQVTVAPKRPSAKRWASGRADIMLTLEVAGKTGKYLLEVKAPRAASIDRGLSDRYIWQISPYYWDIKEKLGLEGAVVVLIDREGSNGVRAFVLPEEKLVPVEAIALQERLKDQLYDLVVPGNEPDQPGHKVQYRREIHVWKKQAPKAFKVRDWQCGYCQFSDHCQPGPEEIEVFPSAVPEHNWAMAKKAAEVAWANGLKTTPFKYKM